mmetsp:Transcript_136811/g.324167  ORF Transcript_136811/g.324167 Transcript_136811/m.324167 type:complete len:253 (+) Transcript_136811:3829-4587(+)
MWPTARKPAAPGKTSAASLGQQMAATVSRRRMLACHTLMAALMRRSLASRSRGSHASGVAERPAMRRGPCASRTSTRCRETVMPSTRQLQRALSSLLLARMASPWNTGSRLPWWKPACRFRWIAEFRTRLGTRSARRADSARSRWRRRLLPPSRPATPTARGRATSLVLGHGRHTHTAATLRPPKAALQCLRMISGHCASATLQLPRWLPRQRHSTCRARQRLSSHACTRRSRAAVLWTTSWTASVTRTAAP